MRQQTLMRGARARSLAALLASFLAVTAGCVGEDDASGSRSRVGALAPVAAPQAFVVIEDGTLFDQLAGSDADGDPLTYAVVSQPAAGQVTIADAAIGTFTFLPAQDVNGPDSFTYQVTAGGEVSNTATVSLTVTPSPDAPVAIGAAFDVIEDASLTDTLTGSDVDGDALSFLITRQAALGTVTFTDSSAGVFTYTPRPDVNGVDTFSFEVNDGAASSPEVVVTVRIAPINDAPTLVAPTPAQGAQITVRSGEPLEFFVKGADVDGDDLTYDVSPLPTGALLDTSTGDLRWTPGDADEGDFPLSISVSDGDLEVERAITVRVEPRDDDDDGVSDSVERAANMDPTTRDSDGDAIDDLTEFGDGDEARDTDNDQIPDAIDDDSDGDGALDFVEAGDDDLDTPPVDTDSDTIPDYIDDDSDGDGELDREDNCRLLPNPDQSDLDGDGDGDVCDGDRDGDGIGDDDDNCPLIANVSQSDNDDDDTGDVCDGDDDNDGFTDAQDNCPLDANRDQLDTDEDGPGDACDPVPSTINVPEVSGGPEGCAVAPPGRGAPAPWAPLALALCGLCAGGRRVTRTRW